MNTSRFNHFFRNAVRAAGVLFIGAAAFVANVAEAVVFTQTNSATVNEILVLDENRDGQLQIVQRVATGGRGTGAGLGSQNAVVLDRYGIWLVAVDAGSNEVSAFFVLGEKLYPVARLASGGERPISVTMHHDLIYVLNAGGTGNITGFKLGYDGKLRPIEGSTQALSSTAANAAQIEFSPDGDYLAVTERATNNITLFDVNERGVASPGVVNRSVGATPFGFAFDRRGRLIVSEAQGGAANASTVSSYAVDDSALSLKALSASVPTNQTAACWIVLSRGNRYAYASNTASNSISGYRIARDGTLTLLNADGRTATVPAGSGPVDMAVSFQNELYVLNGAGRSINAFRIQSDGSLKPTANFANLPAGTTGVAAK